MIINDIIVNKDIVLKLITLNDAEIVYNAINENRTHLRKWLPFVDTTRSVKDTHSFIKSIVDDVERRQEIFTIWYKNEFAGLIGLKDLDYLNRKTEIGYWLTEKMTQKGIITLSVQELLHFIFTELELNRVQIKCGVGNIASSNVPKRLGFTFEGIERQGERHYNKYLDLEIYSILLHEWA